MDSLIDRLPERAARPARGKAACPSAQELPQASVSCVGVVGLGRMGEAFAGNLLSAGYRIVAYDRDRRRAQPLQVEGATAAQHLEDLATCDLVITALPDDAALETVALGPMGSPMDWSTSCRRAPCMSPWARSAPSCRAGWKRPMRRTDKGLWPRPCWAIPILLVRSFCSCWRAARSRRWPARSRCWSGWASACSSSATIRARPTWSSSPATC